VTDLATSDDVAHALGLEDADALSESQSLRVDALLSRVSREFRREAERSFTPGTSTVRLITVAGRIHLVEPVATVTSVTTPDCYGDAQTLDYEIDGQSLAVEQYGRALGSGIPVTVTYTHTEEVPQDVVDAVAAIVARHLTVDPATGPVTEMSAGPFRQRFADWTNKTSLLTEEDCAVARSYRNPATNVIIQRP
jgi:hypothetical protein